MDKIKVFNCHNTNSILNTNDYVLHEDYTKEVNRLNKIISELESNLQEAPSLCLESLEKYGK